MPVRIGAGSHRGARPFKPEGLNKTTAVPGENETLRLIRACKRGDTAAWDKLIHCYQPLLYRFALSFCHNGEEAEDIVGQVMLRLYRSLSSFHEEASFAFWLLRIVRNTFLDLCVRPRHRSLLSLDTGLTTDWEQAGRYDVADPAPSPETLCLEKVVAEEVVYAVRHLPSIQRQIMDLYYTEHKTYEEISEETGLAVGTVKSRLYRARRMLRERLN